LGLVI